MSRRKHYEMTPEQIERMRPIWDAADRAIREHSEYVIEIAKAYHEFAAMSERALSARRTRDHL